ncbi:hypothetical protein [Chengkuizengella axinellae]|uniref:Uncharacterized protein n=1 Tax=Chengkuizengella axinellae TaxID=3064388 RepID=A0ABT9IY15_9BACL|nr:hypothetical protein [Chengkuizengella sp. 2205SS18-9]MDP5273690.1 hypothetical protein [Chengkuizengella sp. 2205SS18-9]
MYYAVGHKNAEDGTRHFVIGNIGENRIEATEIAQDWAKKEDIILEGVYICNQNIN